MHQSIVELASFDVGSRVSSFTCIVGITVIDHDLESDNDKDQNENGFDGDDIDTSSLRVTRQLRNFLRSPISTT